MIALAANKCEPLKDYAIDPVEASKYAKENDLIYMETSAKTPMNVYEIFFIIGM